MGIAVKTSSFTARGRSRSGYRQWRAALGAGDFGLAAGGTQYHLVNRSDKEATYLEVGDRSEGDEVSYPMDDLQAVLVPIANGSLRARTEHRTEAATGHRTPGFRVSAE